MKFIQPFKSYSLNEDALPQRDAQGSTSPVVLYAYSSTKQDEQLFQKLKWGGNNEVSTEIKHIPTASFKITRTCADDAKANYSLQLKDGQATAGKAQARLNPASYHADVNKKYQYTVEAIEASIDGNPMVGIWLIDIAASQPLAAEGTLLNTGKVISQFQQAGKVTGKFVPAKGTSVVFEARSAVMHVVYAPAVSGEVQKPNQYRFNGTFKYNSTQVDLSSKESQATLANLLKDLKSGFKYDVVAHGNASKVPTKYQGGNEKLANDRALALVKAVQENSAKAGVNWAEVVTSVKSTAAVSGPEWKAGSSAAPYEPYQFVTIILSPKKGQQK